MRKLNPIIEWPLIILEMLLIVFIFGIEDFDLKDFPILLGLILIMLGNGYILKKWGKQWR